MTDVVGKRTLITGAASGIGKLLAWRLADAGARLVLWDIDAAGLGELETDLVAAGHEVDIYTCDLTSRDKIAAYFRTGNRTHVPGKYTGPVLDGQSVSSGHDGAR
jgi:NAD(P)-dependent dehydrogenase (short-subunit alcohol dehydrogenase family)